MKFFQKTGVAVAITVLAIAAALFIGLSPVLKSGAETAPVQTVSSQDTSAQTSSASLPASEQTASGTAGDETISNKYIRDEAGLFTRSAENTIKDYNDKIYSKTGSHVAILTAADTGGMSLEGYTNSAFDAMGLSEYDMLFSVDTDTQTWYVTTGAYVADFADSRLESIFKDGFAAMMMPVILVVGILSGYFTPTEGACVATVYSIFIGMFVYRTLTFKKLFKILMDTSVFAGATLFVLSMASIFGLVLTHNQIPTTLTNFFLGLSDNKYILLFLVNILLLILGMLMEGNAIYMIMGPILGVLAVQLGCDPVHFGIMVIFNLTLGLITPPVGLCLFLTQKVAKITTSQMIRSIMPFVIMMIVCLLIITYFPPLVTWLPRLFNLC